MESILEILTCKYCKEIFKSTPIILNCCSETICQNHIDDFKENHQESFSCHLCNKIIDQNIFPINKIAENFLKMNLHELNFGDQFNKSKNSCKKLEKVLKDLEDVKRDPENFIFDYVSNIKNDIDLKREELKLKIDKISNNSIKRIEDFEKKCYENLKTYLMGKKIAELNKEIATVKTKLIRWNNDLKLLVIDERNWDEIRLKSALQCNQLENLLNTFKSELILNNDCKFNKSLDILNDLEKDLTITEK